MSIEPVALPASASVHLLSAPNVKPTEGTLPPTPPKAAEKVDLNAASPANPPEKSEPSRKQVEDAADKVQKFVANQASNLQFSLDEDSGRTVVKVVDASTKEVIRQIPSEEILAIAKALDRLQGLLIRQTA